MPLLQKWQGFSSLLFMFAEPLSMPFVIAFSSSPSFASMSPSSSLVKSLVGGGNYGQSSGCRCRGVSSTPTKEYGQRCLLNNPWMLMRSSSVPSFLIICHDECLLLEKVSDIMFMILIHTLDSLIDPSVRSHRMTRRVCVVAPPPLHVVDVPQPLVQSLSLPRPC